eukprot:91816_1
MSSTPTWSTVKVTVSNKVALIVLNRPKKLNAFSVQMMSDLSNACKWADSNDNVNVLVITGAGRYFSAGNDQSNFKTDAMASSKYHINKYHIHPRKEGRVASIYHINKPIIAAVNGPAIGMAFSMLNYVDIIYASDTATFYAPFLSLAISPECLSSYCFEQIMGKSKANEVLMMGKKLTAKDAERYNFVSEVFPKERFMDIVMDKAYKFANEIPTNGVQEFKKLKRELMKDVYNKVQQKELKLLSKLLVSPEAISIAMKFLNRKKHKTSKL